MKEYVNKAPYRSCMARVDVNEQGDWVLRIAGEGVCHRLWNRSELVPGVFPGASMTAHVVAFGFDLDTSDKRWHPSGWRPVGVGNDAWVIPCYPKEGRVSPVDG